jgi:hypothetical protein
VAQAKWHQPWAEPVRVRPALPAGEQQFLALEPAPIIAIAWHLPLTEPVRVPRALSAALQRAQIEPVYFAGAVPVGWHGPPPSLYRLQYQALAPDPLPRVSFSWFTPLAEPIRARPPVLVPAYEQQASTFDEDIIFLDRWFQWWSEPVRIRPALFASGQQVLALAPQPFPFLGGGGGWLKQPDNAPAPRPGKTGTPRQVEPAQAPPTFAEIIAAHQPAQLADVLGARFAAALPAPGHFVPGVAPPALDLYVAPARPVAPTPPPTISPAAIDDVQDRLDAMEALRVLDAEEQQRKAQMVALLLRIANIE